MSDEAPEPHPCGHEKRQHGCGGCDSGAAEWVIEDDGRWRRPTSAESSIADELAANDARTRQEKS